MGAFKDLQLTSDTFKQLLRKWYNYRDHEVFQYISECMNSEQTITMKMFLFYKKHLDDPTDFKYERVYNERLAKKAEKLQE